MKKPLTKTAVRDLYVKQGLSTKAASIAAGVSEPTFLKYMKLHGVKAREYPTVDADRQKKMKKLKAAGLSLAELGRAYGLSRQRVHQIVSG